jgi:hypothetical protein
MIRKKQPQDEPIVIDITGPDGNAFTLMAYAEQFAKQLGIDHKPIIEELMSGDYDNLLEVFDKAFGNLVILER